ncbi:MAG: hypothetical protein HYS62_02225 [Candidatus Aenigmarchaeota archaeon]|nr:hypothetical protein [Candidatus Aenigmarchaeota archaeon]
MTRVYRRGDHTTLTHVDERFGENLNGRIGFLGDHRIDVYAFLEDIPIAVFSDPQASIVVKKDRLQPNRDVYLIRVPYHQFRELKPQDFIKVELPEYIEIH